MTPLPAWLELTLFVVVWCVAAIAADVLFCHLTKKRRKRGSD